MSICDLTADDDNYDAPIVASTSTSPPCLNFPRPVHTFPPPFLDPNEFTATNQNRAIPVSISPAFIDLTTTPDPPTLTMARRTRARTPPPERPADHSHSLRERKPPAGTYVVSDDSDESDDELRPSQGYKDGGDAASSSEEEEESEPEPEPEVPRERSSAGGRSLRAAASLKPPSGLEDMVSTDKALTTRKKSKRKSKSRAKAKPRPKAKQTKKGEDEGELTVRGEIRQALEETKKRREAFFLKNRELFENLLPESNYISKLADKELELPEPVEYKLLEKQPEQ